MERFDVFVIGGGGTGSSITLRLANAGLEVAMAERHRLGGECTTYGCVPSKALLKAARVASLGRRSEAFGIDIPQVAVNFPAVMARVEGIIEGMLSAGTQPFEDVGATVYFQEARMVGERHIELADGTEIEAAKVVVATGSNPTTPPIEGLEDGFWTHREATHLESLPSSVAILGAGPVGVEFAQIFSRFGVDTTLIEALDRVLPGEDGDASEALAPVLEEEGMSVLAGAKVQKVERPGGRWRLAIAERDPVEADALLIATGQEPVFDGHDLEAVGVALGEDGRPVLTETLRSTNPDVWIAGDATGDYQFVHVNDHKADVVVDDILGNPHPVDYRIAPHVTFCEPEVAGVGMTEEQAREGGHEVKVSVTRFDDDERAQIEGERWGLVKLVADARSGELLGGHIVGEHAGELLAEVIAAMVGRIEPASVGSAIHPYPTLSQAVQGAFRALDRE
jgi:pyruvate/2-oxoglutarate dehydrogenase complex dihydrolipoamide dehydrogenase (E3) component